MNIHWTIIEKCFLIFFLSLLCNAFCSRGNFAPKNCTEHKRKHYKRQPRHTFDAARRSPFMPTGNWLFSFKYITYIHIIYILHTRAHKHSHYIYIHIPCTCILYHKLLKELFERREVIVLYMIADLNRIVPTAYGSLQNQYNIIKHCVKHKLFYTVKIQLKLWESILQSK